MKTSINKAIFTLFVTVSSIAVISAKNKQWQQSEGADRIQTLFFSFAAEKLNLNSTELERFMPVYRAYVRDLKAIHAQYPPNSTLTADQQIRLEKEKLSLREKYIPQFRSALGAEKVNHLYAVERQFEERLKQVRQERQQQQHPGNKR